MKSQAMVFCMALCVIGARAANPDDLDLTLRLTHDPPVFHAGEPIAFEIVYSTSKEGKYRGVLTNPAPELSVVELSLSPLTGVVDLRSLHPSGSAGSILSFIGKLDPQRPITQNADLSDWYRFEAAGHYQLRAGSSQVSRIKSSHEGGGLEPIALESNTVEFDVLPRDPAWEMQQLSSALLDLDAGPAARTAAIRRLALLDNAASVRTLVSLFLAEAAPIGDATAATSFDDYWIYRGIERSAHAELAVPLMEAALEDPQRRPASTLVNLLVAVQMNQAFGTQPEADPAKRDKAYQEYMAQASAKLLASIRQRSGPQRNAALVQAWDFAERSNSDPETTSPALAQLRQEVLASARELPLNDAMNFVTVMWNRKLLPRERLLPLLRYLALSIGRAPKDLQAFLQFDVYPLWCEESPRECDDAILADAAKPDSPLLPVTILLLKEAEHPELDDLLKQRLQAPAAAKDYVEAQKIAALVLRAGSRNLLPAVREALTRFAGNHASDCETRAYLVNYQFRFAPKDAGQYLRTAFQDKETSCGWFHFLGQTRYSDDLIPSAIEGLDSTNPNVAASAALFLGAHGAPDVEEVLWHRLDVFWERWHGRAAELDEATPAAQLEPALVNALTHGANWKLTLTEQDRLRTGCLTDMCRKVASGEISLGP